MDSTICKICNSTYNPAEQHSKDDCVINLIKNQSLAINDLNNRFESFRKEATVKQNVLEGEISNFKRKSSAPLDFSGYQSTNMFSGADTSLSQDDITMTRLLRKQSDFEEEVMPKRSFWDWFGEFNFMHPKAQPNFNLSNLDDNFETC
jgi:hypothetical protein